MLTAIFLFLFAIIWSREWTDQWFLLFAFCSSIFVWKTTLHRLGKLPSILLFYCLISAGYTWLWMHNRYFTVEPYDKTAIKFFAADGAAKLAMIVFVVSVVAKSKDMLREFGGIASLVFIIINFVVQMSQAGYLLFKGHGLCALENVCGGAMGNPSMSISFMVVALPVAAAQIFPKYRWALFSMVGLSVLLSKSAIALGLYICVLIMHMCIIWLPAIMPIGLILYFIKGAEFFSSSLRLEMWRLFMGVWKNNPANWLWGMGYGTFGVFSQNIQRALADPANGELARKSFGLSEQINAHADHWWVWLHNDWLQIIFELGVVGIVLCVATYLLAVKRIWDRGERPELYSLLLYGACMLMNYPTHVHLSALFGAWILFYSLLNSKADSNKEALDARR